MVRKAWDSLRYSLSLVVRVGRWRTLVWVGSLGLLHFVGLFLGLISRGVVDAIVGQDVSRAVTLSLLVALLLAGYQVSTCVMLSFMPKVEEVVLASFDQELVETTLALPAHLHSSPEVQDRLEQLRQQRSAPYNLTYAALSFVFLGLNLVISVVLLSSFSFILLTLPLFGLPLIYARGKQTRAFISLQQEIAEDRRLALGLFRISTSAAQASEEAVGKPPPFGGGFLPGRGPCCGNAIFRIFASHCCPGRWLRGACLGRPGVDGGGGRGVGPRCGRSRCRSWGHGSRRAAPRGVRGDLSPSCRGGVVWVGSPGGIMRARSPVALCGIARSGAAASARCFGE